MDDPPGHEQGALAGYVTLALVLVAGLAGGFWLIGQVRDRPAAPTVAVPTIADQTVAPTGTGPGTADPAGKAGPAGEPATTAPTAATPATPEPSEITVQVLDAAGDGGTRADNVAQRLRAAGFRIIARHRAVRVYERSTLFHTAGHERDARVVQEHLSGFTVVAEKPDNLSDRVDVHVVVGQDLPAG